MAEDIVVQLSDGGFSADPNIGTDIIEVQTTSGGDVANLGDILDVDTSNLNSSTNKFVMIYDSVTRKYKFVNPDDVLDASAGVSTDRSTNPDPLPLGMTDQTLDYLEDELDVRLDNKIDVDAGTF